MSNRYNPFFTDWMYKAHLVAMPAATMSLNERLARVRGSGSVLNPDIAMAEGRSEQAGKTLEAKVVCLPPGSAAPARFVEEQMLKTFRKPATVAHLLALAESHRGAFLRYERIYAFGSIRRVDDATWFIPSLEIKSNRTFVLSDCKVHPDEREVFRVRDDAFALVEDLGHLGHLHCKGCTVPAT